MKKQAEEQGGEIIKARYFHCDCGAVFLVVPPKRGRPVCPYCGGKKTEPNIEYAKRGFK